MHHSITRRDFIGALGAASLWPLAASAAVRAVAESPKPEFRVRTITAGIELNDVGDLDKVDRAVRFLERAKAAFVAEGYEVQTIRVTTQPLPRYLPEWQAAGAIERLRRLDRLADEAGVMFNVGPVLTDDAVAPGFGSWAADLVTATKRLNFTAFIGSADRGVHSRSIRAAAEATVAIAKASSGEGNFRFAATAFIPPGTPFFPAGYHQGAPAFAVGLESPLLLQKTFEHGVDLAGATEALRAGMNRALGPVQALAERLSREHRLHYTGIDTSPAPGLDASIGQAIETLTGVPFGEPSTLAACAAITGALKRLDVKSHGYCGLMLPILEDPILARRADEGRFGITELLAYSSVCGTGLDVVPVPGDTTADELASVFTDVAALSVRLQKPLSARLFPVPGKKNGEIARFKNPYLVDSTVMSIR